MSRFDPFNITLTKKETQITNKWLQFQDSVLFKAAMGVKSLDMRLVALQPHI